MTRARVLGVLAGALTVAVVGATAVGSVVIAPEAVVGVLLHRLGGGWGVDPKDDAIVALIRLPRVLGAALIGGALATSGAALQALLRNPMADPGLLGVSGGAGLGAVLSIALGLSATSPWWTPGFAVLGALGAAAIILGLSFRGGRTPVVTVILAGLAVSTFLGAGTSLVLTFASHDNVAQFLFWAMGTLSGLRWDSLALVTGPVLVGLGGMLVFARDLNVLLLGDDAAQSLGIHGGRTRLIVLVLVAVTTAGAVCAAGPVGFVGLLVPPWLRRIVGADNRTLLPASALGGALFLVLCDLGSRIVGGPREINIGIVTALVGAPYFLVLLVRSAPRENP